MVKVMKMEEFKLSRLTRIQHVEVNCRYLGCVKMAEQHNIVKSQRREWTWIGFNETVDLYHYTNISATLANTRVNRRRERLKHAMIILKLKTVMARSMIIPDVSIALGYTLQIAYLAGTRLLQ